MSELDTELRDYAAANELTFSEARAELIGE